MPDLSLPDALAACQLFIVQNRHASHFGGRICPAVALVVAEVERLTGIVAEQDAKLDEIFAKDGARVSLPVAQWADQGEELAKLRARVAALEAACQSWIDTMPSPTNPVSDNYDDLRGRMKAVRQAGENIRKVMEARDDA